MQAGLGGVGGCEMTCTKLQQMCGAANRGTLRNCKGYRHVCILSMLLRLACSEQLTVVQTKHDAKTTWAQCKTHSCCLPCTAQPSAWNSQLLVTWRATDTRMPAEHPHSMCDTKAAQRLFNTAARQTSAHHSCILPASRRCRGYSSS